MDISLFINDLPNGKDTAAFSTENASGSTSQAAGVVEGMEAGCRLFLIDEDTSATNFMVRDEFMQQVISREKEPITPFLERARGLYEQAGASTILVAGSSGAFFHIADRVIQMDCYRPVDITKRVKELCAQREAPVMGAPAFRMPRGGRTMPAFAAAREGDARGGRGGRGGGRGGRGHGGGCRGYDADRDERGQGGGRRGRDGRGDRDGGARGRERLKVRSQGRDAFSLGKENVDVRFVEQIADPEQTAALAHLLRYGLRALRRRHVPTDGGRGAPFRRSGTRGLGAVLRVVRPLRLGEAAQAGGVRCLEPLPRRHGRRHAWRRDGRRERFGSIAGFRRSDADSTPHRRIFTNGVRAFPYNGTRPVQTLGFRTREVRMGNKPIISKQQILDAAFALASESGLAGLSIRDVARACNVAVGTVYNSYPPRTTSLTMWWADSGTRRWPTACRMPWPATTSSASAGSLLDSCRKRSRDSATTGLPRLRRLTRKVWPPRASAKKRASRTSAAAS